MFNELLERYFLTKADFENLKSLNTVESLALQIVIEELYNANGELAVKKYLENTREMDELMVDHINVGNVSTAVYDEPYRLNIFIPDYPPRLKEHNKTKFSTQLGYDTSARWQHYMGCAIHDLYTKGAHQFEEKAIAIFKYHFIRKRSDVDNYAIRFINNAFKYSGLLIDDDHSHLSVYSHGIVDMENKGLEITIISQLDYIKNVAAYI